METGQRITWLARLHGSVVLDCRLLNPDNPQGAWLKYKGICRDHCRHVYVSPGFQAEHGRLYEILKAAVKNSKWKMYAPWPHVTKF